MGPRIHANGSNQSISGHAQEQIPLPLRGIGMTNHNIDWLPSAFLCANVRQKPKPAVSSLLRLRFLLGFADGDGLSGIADLEASEAADGDVLSQLANFAGDQLM